MKALQIPEPGQARLVDVPEPVPQPGEARLRLRALGLCGSDLSIYAGRMPLVGYPRIIGHELAAEVLDVDGPQDRVAVGDLVTVEPYFPCGTCVACRRGRRNCCRSSQTLGVQRDGCAAEQFCLPVEKLHRPPAALEPAHLALAEPIGVGYHAARRAEVCSDDRVVILGAGPIGLAAMQSAKAFGARTAAVDLKPTALALAATLGADLTVEADADDALEQIAAFTDGDGADVVIEAVGATVTIERAIELASYAGRVVLIGYGAREVTVDPKSLVAKELDVRGSRNSLDDFPAVLEHLCEGTIRVGEMISRTVPLADAPSALADWAAQPEDVVKIVVTCD